MQNVSLEIFEGEFLALVGHNGSGKSTLAKLLNGLLLAQSGEVCVDGLNPKVKKSFTNTRAGRNGVSESRQSDDSVHCGGRYRFRTGNLGVPREEIVERVEGALESVGMSEYHDKTPTKLSGGQKQRIAIAGVLAIRPRVLVLDEATSMLDPQGRKDVMDTVKRLNREGITVVAITHFMDEVTEADRVAVLSEGELVMQGAPREIFKEKDKLHGYGLDVPRSVALSHELFSAGLEIEPAIFDVDELGDEICRLLSDN